MNLRCSETQIEVCLNLTLEMDISKILSKNKCFLG